MKKFILLLSAALLFAACNSSEEYKTAERIQAESLNIFNAANNTRTYGANKYIGTPVDSLMSTLIHYADTLRPILNSSNERASKQAYEAMKSVSIAKASVGKRQAEIQKIKEEQEAERQRLIQRAEDIKTCLSISSVSLSSANSCGGRDFRFNFRNTSKKTIKYLHVDVEFYNRVGDLAYCEIRDRCRMRGTITGPISAGSYYNAFWDCAIYNWAASSVKITGIDIVYTDGSTLNISSSELPNVKGYKS